MAVDHVKFFIFVAVLQHHWTALDELGKAVAIQDLVDTYGVDTIRDTLPYLNAKKEFPDVASALEAAINQIQ